MPADPRLHYRPDIDGLRAVAISSVVVFHAFPGWAPGGFVGVDVFFVISGYLITSLILKALPSETSSRNSFSFRSFYAHRIRRIFPALILVLAGCLALGWFVLLADEYKQLGKQVVTGAAFAENLSLWGEADYFDTAAELKPLLHLWSLGIEEQFYIVWPILLVLAARLRLNTFALIAGIAIASFAANILAVKEHAALAFYSPITRMWELMAGGTLAYIHVHRSKAPERWKAYLLALVPKLRSMSAVADLESGAGLLLILAAVFFLDKRAAFPGWWALLPTIGACLIIAAGTQASINRQILASRLFVFVGLISSPLYLWHWPLLSFARILQGGAPSPALRIAAVALSLILACLSYWLVEKRVRLRKHWAAAPGLACALMLIAGAGYNVFDREGLEFRLKGSELQRVKFNVTLQYQTQCRRDFKFAQNAFCLRGSEDRPPTVALIGDSHAMTLYPGLGHYYAAHGENLVHFGIGGGIPFYGVERIVDGKVTDYYAKLFTSVLDYVSNDAGIKTILLMNRAVWENPSDDLLRYELDPGNTDTLAIYGEAMAHTLEKLLAARKEVVVVIDNPMMDFAPGSCVPRPSGLAPVRMPCALPRATYDRRTHLYREKVEDVLRRFPDVKRWDLADSLCDSQYCWAMKDGTMLYGRDGQHLSITASYWLADHFAPR